LGERFRPGGTASNEAHFGARVRFPSAAEPIDRALLYDPQTSGGLLASVEGATAAELVDRLRSAGVHAAIVGRVEPPEPDGTLIVVD
jgi:selenide,water dikinase